MSNAPPKEHHEGPDFVAYYKQLFLLLLYQNEEIFSPSKEDNSQGIDSTHKGETSTRQKELVPPAFNDIVGYGLSQHKKERLGVALREAVASLNQEADEIINKMIEMLPIKSDKDLTQKASKRKRKAHYNSDISQDSNGFHNVHGDIQSLQGPNGKCETIDIYSAQLLDKVCKMEQDVDGLLNEIVKHCRPMSIAEKHQLGRNIHKLPEKSFDRVVDLFKSRNLFSQPNSERLSIDLDKQDDVTLWRLYYYVDTVLQAGKI